MLNWLRRIICSNDDDKFVMPLDFVHIVSKNDSFSDSDNEIANGCKIICKYLYKNQGLLLKKTEKTLVYVINKNDVDRFESALLMIEGEILPNAIREKILKEKNFYVVYTSKDLSKRIVFIDINLYNTKEGIDKILLEGIKSFMLEFNSRKFEFTHRWIFEGKARLIYNAIFKTTKFRSKDNNISKRKLRYVRTFKGCIAEFGENKVYEQCTYYVSQYPSAIDIDYKKE